LFVLSHCSVPVPVPDFALYTHEPPIKAKLFSL
jgi:hypothetical protein